MLEAVNPFRLMRPVMTAFIFEHEVLHGLFLLVDFVVLPTSQKLMAAAIRPTANGSQEFLLLAPDKVLNLGRAKGFADNITQSRRSRVS